MRGSSGWEKTQLSLSLMNEEGYEAEISMRVRVFIDDWKARLVNEHLATGRGGRKINHYWLIKNMMGTLMEDML